MHRNTSFRLLSVLTLAKGIWHTNEWVRDEFLTRQYNFRYSKLIDFKFGVDTSIALLFKRWITKCYRTLIKWLCPVVPEISTLRQWSGAWSVTKLSARKGEGKYECTTLMWLRSDTFWNGKVAKKLKKLDSFLIGLIKGNVDS